MEIKLNTPPQVHSFKLHGELGDVAVQQFVTTILTLDKDVDVEIDLREVDSLGPLGAKMVAEIYRLLRNRGRGLHVRA